MLPIRFGKKPSWQNFWATENNKHNITLNYSAAARLENVYREEVQRRTGNVLRENEAELWKI